MRNFYFLSNLCKTIMKTCSVVAILLTVGVGEMWGEASKQVTLTFSARNANPWSLPTSKTTDSDNYTNGGITISLGGGGSGNGYYWAAQAVGGGNNDYYLIMGKNGCTLTLPAFTFTTTKIVVVGRSGASAAVKQNVYVGETAVSTETTGATGTNTYNISSSYQAAGNVYKLQVTSAHNSQVTSIEIWGETASCSTNPTVTAGSNSAVTSTTATVSCSSGISSLGSAGCSITSYGFVLNTTGTPTISDTKHQVGTTYTTTGTSFSKDLTGLTPGETYYVRPYATNGNGTAYGTQTSFTMLNEYTLTFKEYVGGAAASGSPSTGIVIEYATSFSYGATPPSKTGYTIEGFYTNTSASSGVKVANDSRSFGASVDGWTNSSSQYTKGANANLYINWTAKTTTIALNKNNSDASGSTAGTASYTYDESTENSYTAATRTGYTLNGYYTAPSSGTKILNADGTIAGNSIVVSTVTYTDASGNWAYDGTSLTLYAQWTIKNYSVTWKVNNTDYTTGTPTSNVNHGSKVTTLPTAPSPASYCGDKFVGWTDATDGEYVHGTSNLYTKASDFPTATEAQIFYAVFADYDE